MSVCKIFWSVFAAATLVASILGIVFSSLELNDPVKYSKTYDAEKAICDASNYTLADGTKIVYVDPNTLGVVFPNATTYRYQKYEDECCALRPEDQLTPYMDVPIPYIDCSTGRLEKNWIVDRDDRRARLPGMSRYCKVPKPYCVYSFYKFPPRSVWFEKTEIRWPVVIIMLSAVAILAVFVITLAYLHCGGCDCCEDYNQVVPEKPKEFAPPKPENPVVVVIPVVKPATDEKKKSWFGNLLDNLKNLKNLVFAPRNPEIL